MPLGRGDLFRNVHGFRPAYPIVLTFDILEIINLAFVFQIHIIKKHKYRIGYPIYDHRGIGGRLSQRIVHKSFDGSPAFAVVTTSPAYYIYIIIVSEVGTGWNSFIDSGDKIAIGCGYDGGDSVTGYPLFLRKQIRKLKFLSRACSKRKEANGKRQLICDVCYFVFHKLKP